MTQVTAFQRVEFIVCVTTRPARLRAVLPTIRHLQVARPALTRQEYLGKNVVRAEFAPTMSPAAISFKPLATRLFRFRVCSYVKLFVFRPLVRVF